jgi:formylmethanofuran dehydrogenase subunit E
MKITIKRPTPPTPKRRQMADDQRKATNDRKRREKSIKYCQRCGEGYYPEERSFLINVRGNKLRVCSRCYEETRND